MLASDGRPIYAADADEYAILERASKRATEGFGWAEEFHQAQQEINRRRVRESLANDARLF